MTTWCAIRTGYHMVQRHPHPLTDAVLAVWAVIIYIEFQAAAVSFGSIKKESGMPVSFGDPHCHVKKN